MIKAAIQKRDLGLYSIWLQHSLSLTRGDRSYLPLPYTSAWCCAGPIFIKLNRGLWHQPRLCLASPRWRRIITGHTCSTTILARSTEELPIRRSIRRTDITVQTTTQAAQVQVQTYLQRCQYHLERAAVGAGFGCNPAPECYNNPTNQHLDWRPWLVK